MDSAESGTIKKITCKMVRHQELQLILPILSRVRGHLSFRTISYKIWDMRSLFPITELFIFLLATLLLSDSDICNTASTGTLF
jgi:hypothetical protein